MKEKQIATVQSDPAPVPTPLLHELRFHRWRGRSKLMALRNAYKQSESKSGMPTYGRCGMMK